MSVLLDTARREWLHIRRDRRLAALLIAAPLGLTLLFGYAFESNAITGIPLAVFDEDGSPASRDLIDGWRRIRPPGAPAPMFRIEVLRGNRARARAALTGNYWGAVHIPPGLGDAAAAKGLQDLRRQRLTLFVDGSDTYVGPQIQMTLHEALGKFNQVATERIIGEFREQMRIPRVVLTDQAADAVVELVELDLPEPLFNPRLNFLSYMMPGVLGMVLMLMTVTLMAGSIASEREQGTLEQIAVSPARGPALLAGKALPYFGAAAFDVACVGAVSWYWFELRPNSGLGMLGVCLLLFVPASLGTGVLIGAVSRTRMQAVLTAVFYLMPALLLSGAFSPLETIPESVRGVSCLFPLTFFARAFRNVWFRDAAAADIAGDLTGMAVLAAVTFAAAMLLFRMRRE